jgi:hypothetical protein
MFKKKRQTDLLKRWAGPVEAGKRKKPVDKRLRVLGWVQMRVEPLLVT